MQMPILKPKRKHWHSVLVFLVLVCQIAIIPLVKAGGIELENKIKAAFLINFMLYVRNKEENNNVRHLCLYNKEKFGGFIHHILEEKNKKFISQKIRITYISLNEPATNCHALFISSIDTQSINLKYFPKDVLTIGEVPGFLSSGGMLNLFIENDSVYFAINMDAINEKDVSLSSQLLKLARTNNE